VSVAVIAVIAVLLVLGVGYLIFVLMRKSQTVVPQVTDEDAASRDLVVGVDEQGGEISASEDLQEPARDVASFDSLLKDEIRDQGREEPVADDES
jgi:hypothetical protein